MSEKKVEPPKVIREAKACPPPEPVRAKNTTTTKTGQG
jgi:hypothetical protein